ncbi:3366_t:CDS:2, partial [Entrophospora sp. SA101]
MNNTGPRINFSNSSQYIGRTVCLVGRVSKKANNSVTIETSDGGEIQGNNYNSKYVEITGVLNSEQVLQETTFREF